MEKEHASTPYCSSCKGGPENDLAPAEEEGNWTVEVLVFMRIQGFKDVNTFLDASLTSAIRLVQRKMNAFVRNCENGLLVKLLHLSPFLNNKRANPSIECKGKRIVCHYAVHICGIAS